MSEIKYSYRITPSEGYGSKIFRVISYRNSSFDNFEQIESTEIFCRFKSETDREMCSPDCVCCHIENGYIRFTCSQSLNGDVSEVDDQRIKQFRGI